MTAKKNQKKQTQSTKKKKKKKKKKKSIMFNIFGIAALCLCLCLCLYLFVGPVSHFPCITISLYARMAEADANLAVSELSPKEAMRQLCRTYGR
jgi:hypothetical protein